MTLPLMISLMRTLPSWTYILLLERFSFAKSVIGLHCRAVHDQHDWTSSDFFHIEYGILYADFIASTFCWFWIYDSVVMTIMMINIP